MSLILLIFCAYLLLYSHGSYIKNNGDGDCELVNVDPWDTQLVIEEVTFDNASTSQSIYENKYKNIESVGKCLSKQCYFDIKLDKETNTFRIFPNEILRNIDGDLFNEKSSQQAVSTTYNLICTNEKSKSLIFKVTVQDTNNHKPQFEKTSYAFHIPMPMPAYIDISQFGDLIKVKDLDFSNTLIKFSSYSASEQGIKISNEPVAYSGTDEEYPYVYRMKFMDFTRLTGEKSFTLIAEDSGTPSSTSEVQITITIDEDHSEPYEPKFIKPSFKYQYNAQSGTIEPLKNDQEPTLEVSRSDIICVVEGDESENFNEPIIKNKRVELSLKNKLSSTDQFISVTLSCYVKTTSETKGFADVIIYNSNSVKFTERIYTSQLMVEKDVQSVVMNGNVELTNSDEDASLIVDPMYADYFRMEKQTGDSWILRQTKNLDDEHLHDISLNILITLQKDDELLDDTIIVLYLPNVENEVAFEKPFFTGKYEIDTDGNIDFSISSTISLNAHDVKISDCSLKGEYSEYFDVKFEDETFKITKKSDLPSDAFKERVISLTLEAAVMLGKNSKTVNTAVLISLVQNSSSVSGDCDCSNTVWIVVTVILSLGMVTCVGGTIYYHLKQKKITV